MRSDIRVCSVWKENHDRPVYTLEDTCPSCNEPAENSAPARFNPNDPYGDYRRRARKRYRDAR